MDRAPAQQVVDDPRAAATGWAGVWAAFTVLTIGAILSMSAWSDVGAASAGFVSTIGALGAVAYMSTAWLLSNRLVISRSPALILLASAYLFCGFAIAAYTVTYPGVAPEWFHGPEASRWFWVAWHAAAALGIIGFVALDDEWSHRRTLDVPAPAESDISARIMLRDAGAFMRGPLLLAFTLVIGSAVWIWRDGALFTKWFGGTAVPPAFAALVLLLDLAAIGLLAVALRRDSLVRAWLLLAAVASLIDVIATSWSGGPSTMGWYFAQACSLIAAATLPLVLLGDLRARLIARQRVTPADPAMLDATTGFYNERGLVIELGRMAQLAVAENLPLLVAVVQTGDDEAPALLRRLFRGSDLIGVTANGDFAVVLTPGSEAGLAWLRRRRRNGERLRIGLAPCDPTGPRPVGDLLDASLRSAREHLSEL